MLVVKNPYDLSEIESLEVRTDVSSLVKAARTAPKLPKEERLEILSSFLGKLQKSKNSLVKTALAEGGKPYRDSVVEVERGIDGVHIAISTLRTLAGSEVPMEINSSSTGRLAFTFHQPRGVVFGVSAFNHPFNLIIHQVVPAVAAGCPVIIKPASATPLSCRAIVNLLHESGLPKELCQFALLDRASTKSLASSNHISFLSFIGSADVGWKLRSTLAPGVTCALEHGGLAPLIVDQSADIERCAKAVAKGGFYHAGQVCVSVQRIYVHRKVENNFVEALCAEVKKISVGDPSLEETDVGPLIKPSEVERVLKWINEGGEIVTGGKRLSETTLEPTILRNAPSSSTIMNNEVFGPVVTIQNFSDLGEAIASANALPWSFQASIFTSDIGSALQAAKDFDALAVMINDHTAFRVDWMPFGGYKNSGLGVGGIPHSIRDMSIEKLVVLRH